MPDLTGTTFALVGAAAGTSYVLFSNIGLSQMGVVPLLRGRLADVNLSPSDKVKTWYAYYKSGARWVIGTSAFSLLCDLYVLRTHPSDQIGKLSLISGLIGALIVPYTLTFMKPTNTELIDLATTDNGSLKDTDSSKVDKLLETWENLHMGRFLAYTGAWACAMAAIVLDTRIDIVNFVIEDIVI